LGQSHTIKTDISDKELSDILQLLDNKISEIQGQGGTVTTYKLAILAALSTTAEQYNFFKKIDLLINKISEVIN
jgi:cell division protein ZapA (FtsZ GTPase activity inhibitor)